MRRLAIPALGLAVLLCVPLVRAQSQAGALGQWTTLSYQMPINPVHLALLRNGKVLVVAGSGNVAAETNFRAGLWDPQSGSITTQSLAWDMFCNAMVVLPDGRVLINGGTQQYDPFHGQLRNAVYDPSTDLFTDVQNMAHGRWYPTVTVLGDGRVMTFSGLTETGSTNTAVEFYTAGSGWSTESAAGWTPPLYPRMHLLRDGRVLYSGSGTGSRIFNPTTKAWTAVVATTNYSGTRTYGSSVLLPLTPADGYQSRVMIFGGGNPATSTTEILDLSATPLHWQSGPAMSQGRIEMNATILPNGKVLATGGSVNDEDATTASLNADLYDPATNAFTSAGVNIYPRLYHSGSLLLPDATVALLGGNPARGSYEPHIEIYSPAYLFNVDGSPAVRPTITSVTPGPLALGGTFQVQTPNAADIASVVLVRPGAPTHAFDMDQRLVRLPYSSGSGVLDVTAPPDGNVAPPGYYMLFVLNSAGVPSIATFVQLTPAPANQAPQASIVGPAADVTINPGQAVSFSGSGTDSGGTIASYSWTFPGGSPASSTQASPGNVTYSSPGTYVASFTVTDNGGLTSQPATRTVVVTDFSLSATPASQAVDPGSSPTYTATVTPGAGFTGVVTFGVTGLPAGATAAFAPGSVTGLGTTTLTVTTSASTPSGTFPLRITATSGPVSHSFDVTLVVNVVVVGDFTITATPASRTVPNGNSTTYAMAIAPNGGFSSSVTLSVGTLPKFVTASFSPASLTSGTSTLTLGTKKQTKTGSYSIVITASGGGRTHTSTLTLIVQ